MPIARVPRSNPLNRTQFHETLRNWLVDSDEIRIGDPSLPGVTAWIYVSHAGHLFHLNADTPRRAIADYMALVARDGEALEWTVVKNSRGKENAVAFGASLERIKSLYLYKL